MIILYIIFICYMPIIALILPRINAVNVSTVWLFFYFLILAFMISSSKKHRFELFNKWFFILVVFYIILFSSVAWSDYSYDYTTLKDLVRSGFLPLCVVIMALNLFEDENNIRLYIKNIMFAAFIIAFISICQMIAGVSSVDKGLRAASTLQNPNVLAIFLVLTLPCMIYGIENRILPKLLGLLLITGVIGGIICTVSRKGVVTMLITFFVYYLLKKQFKKILLFGMAIAALGVILFSITLFSQRFTVEEFRGNLKDKGELANAGWDMFKKKPIIGLGYKGYSENFIKYFPNFKKKKYSSHNIYITELANRGLIGFIPFILIFIYPLYYSVRTLRQTNIEPDKKHLKDMAIICISCLLPFMINGYFAAMFYNFIIIFLLYTQISFILAAKNKPLTK